MSRVLLIAIVYLLSGGVLVMLLSWRRPDLFVRNGQFFAPLAYALIVVGPCLLPLMAIRLVVAPAQWIVDRKNLA